MIFGFNTDIKHENTVYHVQSEAREGERLLQTQIFVKGRCIGKKAASYSELVGRPEFSEERMHEMLKYQHRTTIDNLRNGRIDEAMNHVTPLGVLLAEMTQTSGLDQAALQPISPDASTTAPSPPTLDPAFQLEFLNPDAVVADHELVLQFRVLDAGTPVPGAKLIARLTKVAADGQEHDPVYAQNETEGNGQAAMSLAASVEDMSHAVVLVQAVYDGKSTMKKFRLKSPE